MQLESRWWTYAVVTVVTVLIWSWAAEETREQASTSFRIRFAPSDPARQVITPDEVRLKVELEGSRHALEQARTLTMPLKLTVGSELPADADENPANIADALQKHEALRDTGVRIISVDPALIDIQVDDLVSVNATVQPELPRLQIEGEILVDPPQVLLTLPSRLHRRTGEELVLRAYIDQSRLDQLEPGRPYSLDAKLRPPETLIGQKAVTIEPPSVVITFTVRSRIEETTLPMVRVQIAGPPEDHSEYVVEIDETDKQLANVTIKADGALIRQIEQGEATVVALVHLSSSEKERRIESKAVTFFMALPPQGGGTIVEVEVDGSRLMPVIRLQITERTGS